VLKKEIDITPEIRDTALRLAKRRALSGHFLNRFKSSALEETEDDPRMKPYVESVIGYIGDACCSIMLGQGWIDNFNAMLIDTDDMTHRDTLDISYRGYNVDVKTETTSNPRFVDLIRRRRIHDDELYGRRLYNYDQRENLRKYDIVLYSILDARQPSKAQYWYPVGWTTPTHIFEYEPTTRRPDGGSYPFKCYPIRTSRLRVVDELENLNLKVSFRRR
jgi:hypothetical protein